MTPGRHSPAGITFLDHTADVGIGVRAATPAQLFDRAARGMLALLRGEEDGDGAGDGRGAERAAEPPFTAPSTITLTAASPAHLLADWLREILFLHGTEYQDYVAAEFERLDPADGRLVARVRTEPSPGAVREIKGVTYHELAVEETGDGWTARVIFDV